MGPVNGFRGGTTEARRRLRRFVRSRLQDYHDGRNHPDRATTSELSPHLHFGHIGPREVGLAVRDSGGNPAAIAAFLEQLIVRRELAINFVTHNRRKPDRPWPPRPIYGTIRSMSEERTRRKFDVDRYIRAFSPR